MVGRQLPFSSMIKQALLQVHGWDLTGFVTVCGY